MGTEANTGKKAADCKKNQGRGWKSCGVINKDCSGLAFHGGHVTKSSIQEATLARTVAGRKRKDRCFLQPAGTLHSVAVAP